MRKIISFYIPFLWLSAAMPSCTKDKMPPANASLTIVNAIPGSNTMAINFDGMLPAQSFSDLITYPYNEVNTNTFRLRSYNSSQELAIYQWPDTVKGTDPFLHLTLSLQGGTIYSLFLTGTVAAPDTVFTTDQPPYYSLKDSIAGFRFINLSPGSSPVSVNVLGKPNGSTVSNLPYKAVSAFLPFDATYDVDHITFEFRDAVTGGLLATYTAEGINTDATDPNFQFNNWRYRNATLALLGLPDGTGSEAQTILPITNPKQ